MNRKRLGRAGLLLMIPMVLASCSDDDDKDTGGPESAQLRISDISWSPADPSENQPITVRFIEACADITNLVPESAENDNCDTANLIVQP